MLHSIQSASLEIFKTQLGKARVAKPGQPHLASQAALLWQVIGGAQWLPQCCGSFSTLVPGIYRGLAPSLHHQMKHLSLKSLMYHQQVACVLSYWRDEKMGQTHTVPRVASATWEQPGGCPQSRHRALLGFPKTFHSRACDE